MEKSEDFFKTNKSVENWRLEKPRKTHTHTRFKAILARERERGKKKANWLNLASRKKTLGWPSIFLGRIFALWRQMLWEMFLEKFLFLVENFAFKNEKNRKTFETAELKCKCKL